MDLRELVKSRFNGVNGDHVLEVSLEDLRRLVDECDELKTALREIAASGWNGEPVDFCHPEGCTSPGRARLALAETK